MALCERHGFALGALGADPENGETQSFLSSKLLDPAGFRVAHRSTGSPKPYQHGPTGRTQPGEIDGSTIAKVDQIE